MGEQLILSERRARVDAKLRKLASSIVKPIFDSPVVYAFGSVPNGVDSSNSDLDILIIDDQSSHWRKGSLDVVAVSAKRFYDPTWRSGELATHIAAYGVQLKGSGEGLTQTEPSERAAAVKEKRIRAYFKALSPRWTRFDVQMKAKYSRKLRLDLLRLGLLYMKVPIPPTALLPATAASYDIDPLEVFNSMQIDFVSLAALEMQKTLHPLANKRDRQMAA